MGISNIASNLRPGICTSTTRPTTPYEGQVIYETDTNRVLVWDNAAWVMLTDADQPPGIQLIHSQNFTAADPLDITSIFSSDFRNYKIMLDHHGSVQTTLDLQFFSGTNTLYNSSNYFRYGLTFSNAGVVGNGYAASQTLFRATGHVTTAAEKTPTEITIFQPNTSNRTNLQLRSWDPSNGLQYVFDCVVADTTQFTGIRLDATSGTITGSIRIYGLRD